MVGDLSRGSRVCTVNLLISWHHLLQFSLLQASYYVQTMVMLRDLLFSQMSSLTKALGTSSSVETFTAKYPVFAQLRKGLSSKTTMWC